MSTLYDSAMRVDGLVFLTASSVAWTMKMLQCESMERETKNARSSLTKGHQPWSGNMPQNCILKGKHAHLSYTIVRGRRKNMTTRSVQKLLKKYSDKAMANFPLMAVLIRSAERLAQQLRALANSQDQLLGSNVLLDQLLFCSCIIINTFLRRCLR